MKATLITAITLLRLSAQAEDPIALGITPNHQVNPPHAFKQLACVEQQNGGRYGFSVSIDVPNNQDATAKVFFNRSGEQRSLVATWQVKYILDPGVYASFANQFQKMDISRGPDDNFDLSLQLHSGNGANGVFVARLSSPTLFGYNDSRRGLGLTNSKTLICKFR